MAGITKHHGFIVAGILFVYLGICAMFIPQVFTYRFSETLIEDYKHSQDIPYDVPDRIFLSDSDIHIAAGYLYATGADPTEYNFQHPPFIKYLFGFSTLLFGNPLLVQVVLGMTFLVLSYTLAVLLTCNRRIAGIGTLLVSVDPLFRNLTSEALLDLGQGVLILALILLFILFPRAFVAQGIVLGLACASKFWTSTVAVFVLLVLFQFWKEKQFFWKQHLGTLLVAAVTFTLVYSMAFFHQGFFNIVWFELRTFRYWLNHSVASFPGANLLLFLTGFVKVWWGDQTIQQSPVWSLLWPVSFVTAVWVGFSKVKTVRARKLENSDLLYLFPLAYMATLLIQAPFARYFLVMLPFLYVVLVQLVFQRIGLNQVESKPLKKGKKDRT